MSSLEVVDRCNNYYKKWDICTKSDNYSCQKELEMYLKCIKNTHNQKLHVNTFSFFCLQHT